MCNDYGNNIPYHTYLEAFSETGILVRFPEAAPNLEPRDDIWPTDIAPVIRQTKDGAEFAQLRWGFPPGRPKGAPIINFRSESRRFPKGRCLVPASHFFEFTGTKSPKSQWRFTKAGEDWLCFAKAVATHAGRQGRGAPPRGGAAPIASGRQSSR